jgi:hypothetical protein
MFGRGGPSRSSADNASCEGRCLLRSERECVTDACIVEVSRRCAQAAQRRVPTTGSLPAGNQ